MDKAMTPTLDALVRQLRKAMAQATPEPWELANLSNFQINAGGARAIVCQSTHDARYLLLCSPANMATLLDALTAAQQDEAHVREELASAIARIEEEQAETRRVVMAKSRAEAEAARLREQRDDALSELTDKRRQVSALQGELAEAQATITAICVVLAGQAGVTDDELALPCVRRVVEALAALNRSNALLTMTEEGARVLRAERDAALRELAEAQEQIEVVDREVSHVYDHLTRGRISYPHTNAQAVISTIEDFQTQDIDEAVKEATDELRGERDAAREALRRYGRHEDGCEYADDVCGCGLEAALGQPAEPQP